MMDQVYFDGMASQDNWGIILLSLHVGDAEPKEHFVDIPNGDGSLDLTEALTGEVSYSNRPFQAEFFMSLSHEKWRDSLTNIRSYLNGRERAIRISGELGFYLVGRCKTDFQNDGFKGTLTISATCEPWKYKNEPTKRILTIESSGTTTATLMNSRKRVIPTITTSGEVTILFNGKTIVAGEGSHRYTNIALTEGRNEMTLVGEAGTTVTIEYQEGAL